MNDDIFEGNEADFIGFEDAEALIETSRAGGSDKAVAFRRFFDNMAYKPDYFGPDEFLILGPSHGNPNSNCFKRNDIAPEAKWENVVPLVEAMDLIRKELGYPVRITNCYRGPEYNECVGGVPGSQHQQFKAADFVGSEGDSSEWAAAAKAVRVTGHFSGGIGIYRSFVHVDVRGSNANWDKR